MGIVIDVKCDECLHVFEDTIPLVGVPVATCPCCGSGFTKRIPSTFKSGLAKDPYDYLDTFRDYSTKPIKSFAKDKRKGGKDTT